MLLSMISHAKSVTLCNLVLNHAKNKATQAVNDLFEPPRKTTDNVLFYLPVTWTWLCQLILCLVLHCRASHRGIQTTRC